MSCINKSHPDFKKLEKAFGQTVAEMFVRQYSEAVKGLKDDFYYPSISEMKKFIVYNREQLYNIVTYSLDTNPNLSKTAIKQLLTKVIHTYEGNLWISTGRANTDSVIINEDALATIFRPNLKFMMALVKRYPNIFKIKDGKNRSYSKIVEINAPAKTGPAERFTRKGFPDAQVKEKYFKDGNTQKASSILEKISASTHPLNKLAAHLLTYAKRLDVDVILEEKPYFENEKQEIKRSAGYYDVGKRNIRIASQANVLQGKSEHLLLHEILHALSYDTVNSKTEISRDFKKLYDHAVEKLGKFDPVTGEGLYGLHDMDEFMVALFTDSQLINKLQGIDAIEGKKYANLFEEIIDHILKLLGLNKSDNLYNQAFATATNILQQEVESKEALSELESGMNVEDQSMGDMDELFQQKKTSTETSKASPKTIAMVKDFLKRIGVDVENVRNIAVNGVRVDANGLANITQKLVQVVEGMEAGVLPEEAMHFAVEILEQTNPELFNKLLKEINGYRILQQVMTEYGKDPNYQTKDGKPDIRKLKKEAIGKVLAETLIRKSEGSLEKPENIAKVRGWWKQIVDFLRGLFSKSGFDQAAMSILKGENIGTAEDLRSNGLYLQQADRTKQDQIFDKLKEIKATIEKKEDGYYVNGKKVKRRVSDLVKDWYERRFTANDLTKNEYQNSVNDLKAEKGTAGHADLEYAFDLFVDENGYLREQYLNDDGYVSQINPHDRAMYEMLRDNLRERLESFDKGTRFMSEATIYDAKRDLAGTVDFLAISPEGKMSILDWKFMDLNVDKYEDVPWYKVNAWNTQMDQYKLIMKNVYGLKEQDFDQTRMIPIKAFYTQGNPKEGILPQLTGIKIGAVNVKNIEEAYLLPVGLEAEKTGNKKIDALLEKLNAIYRKLSEQKVLPSEKLSKAEQLNALFTAIRQLKMKQNIRPLIQQARILNKQVNGVITKYNNKFLGKDPKSFSPEEISEFAETLENSIDALDTYTELDTQLKFMFQGTELSEEDKALREMLRDAVDDARDLKATLKEIDTEYTSEIIAGSENVEGLSKAEKIVRGLGKWFGNTATIQLKALETLFKKANRAFTFAGMDTLTETKRLQKIKEDYQKWAASKGYSIKNQFDIIKKKDKNELIDEFNPEFYSKLKEKIQNKETDWIMDNVDAEAYIEHIKAKLQEEYERIDNKARIGSDEEIDREITKEKNQAARLYDVGTPTSPGWLLYDDLKKFPKRETWESKDWKTLNANGNEPALAFYNYIKERNDYYQSIGYIHAKQARTFLPWVRKGLAEKLIFGGNISLGEQFLRNISIDEGDIGYGKIDPLSGKLVDSIPIYFTKEVEGEASTDLFRTMALYNEMAIKFKYLTDIEAQGRALIRLEKNKKAIKTSFFGKTEYKDGVLQHTPDNDENAKIIEDMVKSIIYQQRYIQSETFDQVIGKLGNFGERLNKKLGMKLFPENLTGRQLSVNKIITNINHTFQLNALGLNVLSSMSNLFGGTAQSLINAGKYYTKADFVSTEMWMLGNKMGGPESKLAVAAMHYFMPFTDNMNKEIAKNLSLSKLSAENVQDFIMIMMRESDKAVQAANFFSYLRNSIVVDGQVLNAREYMRTTPEFEKMYEGTADQRKKRAEDFEKAVEAIVKEKGVMKVAQIVDGEMVIPGVDRKSQSILELRTKVQQINSDALGSLSEANKRLINMNVYGNSFMIFKNWIPRLVDVRVGNMKYNAASDAYEWGRMRTVYRVVSEDLLGALGNLKDSLMANDKGIDFMRKLYEKKKEEYEKDTDKELKLTEDQFIDMVRANIKNQMIDVIFFATLLAIVASLKANAPDKDEDPVVKNQYKFLLRASDKFADEITYFYDPTSLTKLVSGGIFPSIRMIDNYKNLVTHFGSEMFGLAIGDEKRVKEAHPIKYLMRSFPVTSQATALLPMFYPNLAKDLGIKMQSQSGIR